VTSVSIHGARFHRDAIASSNVKSRVDRTARIVLTVPSNREE
jgi:hypothetical protein